MVKNIVTDYGRLRTNGATIQGMSRVNTMIRLFLSTLEVPLLSGIVLTILIVGEMNLFSPEVSYQTEPITSIGKKYPPCTLLKLPANMIFLQARLVMASPYSPSTP